MSLNDEDYPALIETIVLLKQCSSEFQIEEEEQRQCRDRANQAMGSLSVL